MYTSISDISPSKLAILLFLDAFYWPQCCLLLFLLVLCQLPHRHQGYPVGQICLSSMLDTFLCCHLHHHVSKDVLIHVIESSLCQLCGLEIRFATVWFIHCFVEMSQPMFHGLKLYHQAVFGFSTMCGTPSFICSSCVAPSFTLIGLSSIAASVSFHFWGIYVCYSHHGHCW